MFQTILRRAVGSVGPRPDPWRLTATMNYSTSKDTMAKKAKKMRKSKNDPSATAGDDVSKTDADLPGGNSRCTPAPTQPQGHLLILQAQDVALVHRVILSSGQVLLVLRVDGGVGLAAIQIGKVVGANFIAVARGAEKVEYLKQLGVDHVVDSSSKNVILSVKDFLKSPKA
ncbi:hypothetical protein C1H46_016870 [Malus baccata]|uniref:Alcohol dehydrogenase-like C-terminal domain-containing protein n=1 Tax=Malus baccata TaxID=106549 RepID=A0A540MFQ9_MALBA|nr:hypothetical protein C1H46_016870 [Malus baccata]